MSDRVGDVVEEPNHRLIVVFGLVLIVVIAVAGWFFLNSQKDTPVEVVVADELPAPVAPPSAPQAPDIPEPQPQPAPEPVSQAEVAPEPEPLPALMDSDALVKERFSELSSDVDYQLIWQADQLLQRWVTVIDGAANQKLIRGVVAVPPPSEKFPVYRDGGRYFLDPAGFERYDQRVTLLTSLPVGSLTGSFHTLRPLLEEAYGQMGQDPEAFDNTLIQLLNRVIDAPVYVAPLELNATSVNYTFADPELEALPDLEKLLIRMGPENTAKLQAYAKALKKSLLDG